MIEARLPAWAIWAGFPEPEDGEDFCDYVRRLGLDPEPMLDGLSERTYVLANHRLASVLMQECPNAFEAYITARRAVWH